MRSLRQVSYDSRCLLAVVQNDYTGTILLRKNEHKIIKLQTLRNSSNFSYLEFPRAAPIACDAPRRIPPFRHLILRYR
jgi:hypothetical protein